MARLLTVVCAGKIENGSIQFQHHGGVRHHCQARNNASIVPAPLAFPEGRPFDLSQERGLLIKHAVDGCKWMAVTDVKQLWSRGSLEASQT
jgi:hypothetical protein